MKTMKIILIAILVLLVVALIVYGYYGGFKKIEFTVSEQGGEILIYEDLTGDYRQSPVVMDKVYYSLLNNENIETYRGFGIYYDNPQKVEKSKLRSEVGCILEAKDSSKVEQLKNRYKVKSFPRKAYIVTEFPFNGPVSVFIGVVKVYPAMNDYLKQHGYSEQGAVMEIYDTPNNKIVYRKEAIKE